MTLQTSIEEFVKKPNIAKDLRKLGIETISDLLFYFPFRYEDFSNVISIINIKQGDQISIKATIKQIKAFPGFQKHLNRAEAVVSDNTGSLKAVWFNQSYLANTFKKGDGIFLAGTVQFYKTLQLQNPIYEKIEQTKEQVHTARIIPVYRLTANLSLRSLRTIIFEALKFISLIEETLSSQTLKALDLMEIKEVVRNLHFPENTEKLDLARRRIAFNEILVVQQALYNHAEEQKKLKAPQISFNKFLIQDFLKNIPFSLTNDQKRAAWDIMQDMTKAVPMNRLLEGDVGSGKTLVAFLSALGALNKNLQVVLLCPTEILAQQHYKSASKYFEKFTNISLILLSSKDAVINGIKRNKNSVLEEVRHGGPQFIISTHAVLQKNLQFNGVGLLIIDEQHRFGVEQRENIMQKNNELSPHMLSMSATPIPRTLKMSLLGHLDISQITKLPPGRKPVITKMVSADARNMAYQFIKEQIKKNKQVFVVTPLIDESDKLGVKSATAEHTNLKKIFRESAVGLLHGRMKKEHKDEEMQKFLQNKIQVLVSTSVIEVGVDVPNATVMVIEGAERFGLAQLHQFRGRVGRSQDQSYCFLFTENTDEKVLARLEQFSKTWNGFELAEIDLKMRGYGNLFGAEQSGFYGFKFFNFTLHKDLAEKAKKLVEQTGYKPNPT